jgi:hypothetical protein
MFRHVILACCTLTSVAWATPCRADPPAWTLAWRGDAPLRPGAAVAVAYAGSAAAMPVARGLPYGFNRGTCDHGMIARAGAPVLDGGEDGGDAEDRDCVAAALDRLPDDRMISWQGPDGAARHLVTIRSYRADNDWCRDIEAIQVFGGGHEIVTACRRRAGRWALIALTAH